MIVREYCDSMGKQLAAWRINIEKLLIISETVAGPVPTADERRQKEDLMSLIDDIGRVTELLKEECLVA